MTGLMVSVVAMILNFMGKSKKGGGGHGHGNPEPPKEEEMQPILDYHDEIEGDVELLAPGK